MDKKSTVTTCMASQPALHSPNSGLSWAKAGMNVFVADAESSTLRTVLLTGGADKNLVGSFRDPTVSLRFSSNTVVYP